MIPVDIKATTDAAAFYTDRKRSFVVFANGTCVLVGDGAKVLEKEAAETLNKIFYAHPDFNPIEMKDGNWIVEYSQPAFSIVFKSEIERHWDYIDRMHLEALATDEVLMSPAGPNKFDRRGKIGLYGRARMFMDAQDPKAAFVWRPQA